MLVVELNDVVKMNNVRKREKCTDPKGPDAARFRCGTRAQKLKTVEPRRDKKILKNECISANVMADVGRGPRGERDGRKNSRTKGTAMDSRLYDSVDDLPW